MKTRILFMMLLAIGLFSCQKQETDPVVTQQEVVFNASLIIPGNLKSSDEWECKDLTVDYARIRIGDDFYYTEVYRIDGILYTQALKFDVPAGGSKDYVVNEFYLMHDGGTKGDYEDNEEIVMATPTETSPYKEYVSDPVALTFTLFSFTKGEIPIDVLCFEDADYTNFGFSWFHITEIVIREQCFFGDICADPDDYTGSPYEGQENGLQIDMPAIFYVTVFKDADGAGPGQPVEVPYSPFGNIGWKGEGAPLCVEYPDDLSVTGEVFEFKLYVLTRDDLGNFTYAHYFSWTVVDAGMIVPPAPDGDGIVDFIIGDCGLTPPDITITEVIPPPPPEDPTCETAYAYNSSLSTCFLTIPEIQNNRWGWTNGPMGQGTYSFELYAGAAGCNLGNGVDVGYVDVVYSGDNVTVSYTVDVPGLAMYGIHIFIDDTWLPVKNGQINLSPGQYTWVDNSVPGLTTYSHTFTGWSGDVWVIAHADVCGIYPDK